MTSAEPSGVEGLNVAGARDVEGPGASGASGSPVSSVASGSPVSSGAPGSPVSSGAPGTPDDPAGLRLRSPAHRLSPRARGWWRVRSGLNTLVLLAPQLVASSGLGVVPGPVVVLWITAGVTLALGIVHLAVVPAWRFRLHRWEATDDAVHTQQGWLRLEWRIAPISRIQTVDTDQGPLQRLFRLSSVTVTTASASGALHIDGLDTDEASRLARSLTAATQAVGGDAT